MTRYKELLQAFCLTTGVMAVIAAVCVLGTIGCGAAEGGGVTATGPFPIEPVVNTAMLDITDGDGDALQSSLSVSAPDLASARVSLQNGALRVEVSYHRRSFDAATTVTMLDLDTDRDMLTGFLHELGLGVDYELRVRGERAVLAGSDGSRRDLSSFVELEVSGFVISVPLDAIRSVRTLNLRAKTMATLNSESSVILDYMPDAGMPAAHFNGTRAFR